MIYKVVLIKIDHRSVEAVRVQSILTEFGCNIKVRLGLHEVTNEFCANDGLIILEVQGDSEILEQMLQKLNQIEHVTAKMCEM